MSNPISRRSVIAGTAGGALLSTAAFGLPAARSAGASTRTRSSRALVLDESEVLRPIASRTTDFEVHDLAADAAEILSGTFTPATSTVQIAVSGALSTLGTARGGVLLYVGQPAVPGTRLYNAGAEPVTGADWYPIGSVGWESPWATTTYRTIELTVNPAKDVTWSVLAAIIGGAGTVPTGDTPGSITITPDGTKAYVANFAGGTVTPIVLGRPGFSIFNELQPQDVGKDAITTGAWPVGITSDDTHAVVCNFFDTANRVSIIDVATDSVARNVSLDAGQNPLTAAISPDGAHAYVCTYQGRLYKVTIATGATSNITLSSGKELRGIGILADGSAAFVGNFATNVIHRVNLSTFTAGPSIIMGGPVTAVRVAPDGNVWAAIKSNPSKLKAVNPANNSVIHDYTLPYGGVNDFAIVAPSAGQPVRTAFVTFDGSLWRQFYIGGDFAGQSHTQHGGTLPGGAEGVAVNDFGEIWITQGSLDQVWKFPGGRIFCRPAGGGFDPVFFGEYLDVLVMGAAAP